MKVGVKILFFLFDAKIVKLSTNMYVKRTVLMMYMGKGSLRRWDDSVALQLLF